MSKTDMAILGMLTVEPMSGYEMKRFCEQSLAHFWRETYGNLYPRLRRLAREGLVRSRRRASARGPESIVYALTAKGRARLRDWLREEDERERVRSEFLLKFFFGAETDLAVSVVRVRAHQREQLGVKRAYVAVERLLKEEANANAPAAPYWRMSLRRGQILTEARLKWCAECLDMLEAMGKEAKPDEQACA